MIYFLAGIAAMAGFLFGYDEGVIAVARPSLDRDFPMSPLMAGFVTAAVPLGALIAAALAGRITDHFGRRRVLMTSAALFAVGALLAAGATHISLLALARLVLGLAVGAAAVVAPLYIAEAAPLAIRGGLVSAYQLAITVGILVSYLAGLAIAGDRAWRLLFGLGAVPGALFLVGLIFLPESPRWLLLKGLSDRARPSLQRLRGTTDIDREFEEMRQVVQAEASLRPTSLPLFAPRVRPAVVIAMTLFFLQQLSGINAVIYYAPQIFAEAGFDSVSTQVLATVGVGAVNLLTTVAALFLIDRIGRRRLLMTGFMGTAATLLIIAFAVVHPAAMPTSIVVVMLLLYIAFFAVSLGPLPHVMMSEIFPLRVRGQGMSMASVSNWGFNFVVVLLFPVLLAGPGLAFAFSLFAAVCIGGLLFTFARVPETTGLSLEAIERHLESGLPLATLGRAAARP